ncbi:MAG: hypothetical protein IH951_13115 [Bacteroidetes bacterium]|nr:hypothetical protein [Bacteroidota bacterium]
MFSLKSTKVGPDGAGIVFELDRAYDSSVSVECRQKAGSLIPINTWVTDRFHEVPLVSVESALLMSEAGAFLELSSMFCLRFASVDP